jgi:TetR/AcrR family transcriptional regulator, mexJK operon transcriptional repressor
MPRSLGQIDARKHQAILDAAAEVLGERGFAASIEEVARRAGVSKQTIYNQYGSKLALIRTLMDRRRSALTAAIREAGAEQALEDVLTTYAKAIIDTVMSDPSIQLVRMAVAGATEMPELGAAVYEAGINAATEELAQFLAARPELEIDDARRGADIFMGMALGRLQTRRLLGLSGLPPAQTELRAREAARRFIRAFQAT